MLRSSFSSRTGRVRREDWDFSKEEWGRDPDWQRYIASLLCADIATLTGCKVLEVSTKSKEYVGVELSAFNLKLDGYSLESVYQSSKVFNDGTTCESLLELAPLAAKHSSLLSNKSGIKCFRWDGYDWDASTGSAFYDWIYIKAFMQTDWSQTMIKTKPTLDEYDVFTDFHFNKNTGLNCQARSVALYVLLYRNFLLRAVMSTPDNFIGFHKNHVLG